MPSVFTPLSRRWHAQRVGRPWLLAALVLLAINGAYYAWSHSAGPPEADRLPPELNAASIVLLTPEEGQHRQALVQAQAAARAKIAPDMFVEFEATPAKEIPPDR